MRTLLALLISTTILIQAQPALAQPTLIIKWAGLTHLVSSGDGNPAWILFPTTDSGPLSEMFPTHSVHLFYNQKDLSVTSIDTFDEPHCLGWTGEWRGVNLQHYEVTIDAVGPLTKFDRSTNSSSLNFLADIDQLVDDDHPLLPLHSRFDQSLLEARFRTNFGKFFTTKRWRKYDGTLCTFYLGAGSPRPLTREFATELEFDETLATITLTPLSGIGPTHTLELNLSNDTPTEIRVRNWPVCFKGKDRKDFLAHYHLRADPSDSLPRPSPCPQAISAFADPQCSPAESSGP